MTNDIEQILPHRKPMIMVDSLVHIERDSAMATKTFKSGDYGLHGRLVPEPLLIECLAQTVAALNGCHARLSGKGPARGMLAGVTGFKIHSPALADIPLELNVTISRFIGPFCLACGQIRQQDRLVAEGNLKFFLEEQAVDSAKPT